MLLDPCINSSLDVSLLCGSGSGLQDCVHSLKATTFVRQHQYILLGLINTSLVPRSSPLPLFDPMLQVIKTWRWGRPGSEASQCKVPPHGTTICLPDVTWHHCTWDYHLSAWCYMTSLHVGLPSVCLMLHDITADDKISHVLSLSAYIQEVIKYWRQGRPGNEATLSVHSIFWWKVSFASM